MGVWILTLEPVTGQNLSRVEFSTSEQLLQFSPKEWLKSLDSKKHIHEMKWPVDSTYWVVQLTEYETQRKPIWLNSAGYRKQIEKNALRCFHLATINGQSVSGVICLTNDQMLGSWTCGDNTWDIEPIGILNNPMSKDAYRMYKEDLAGKIQSSCGVKHTAHSPEVIPHVSFQEAPCIILDIALAADKAVVERHGSIDKAALWMLSILNAVQANYDDEFNSVIEFEVSEIYVAGSTQDDPWNGISTIDEHLEKLRSWAEAGGFAAPYSVATAWTGKSYGVYGLAYVGSVCTPQRYNVCSDIGGSIDFLRTMQAHELGHCLNAIHDGGGNYIMSATLNNSKTWSPQSKNSINSFIKNLACVGICSEGLPPIAQFTADKIALCEGGAVRFSNTSERYPNEWFWEFPGANPSTSTSQNPIVQYPKSGIFDVKLTVSNAFGSDQLIRLSWIDVGAAPIAKFTMTIKDSLVTFSNESKNTDGWLWNFGDGFSATEENPKHIYASPGKYVAQLCCYNVCDTNCTSLQIQILSPLQVNFSCNTSNACAPANLKMINQSKGADRYRWEFQGGQPAVSTQQDPKVSYTKKGLYSVALTAWKGKDSIRLWRKDYFLIKSPVECTRRPANK